MFYSAAAYACDIREGIRAGAQECLIKPIIPDELRRTVAHLISAARKEVFEALRAEIAAI
jgi:CheY-like chemotaxis protein